MFVFSHNDAIFTALLLVDIIIGHISVIGLMKSLKCIVSVAFNFCHTMRYFTWQSIPYSEHDEECYSESDSKCSVKRETQGKMTSSWAHPLDLCYKRGKRFPRGEIGEPNTRWKRESREVCLYMCVFGRRWLTYTGLFPSLRWGESVCWLTRISLFFLFFSSLWEGWRQTEGSLGDWCQWLWLLLLGLWQMV